MNIIEAEAQRAAGWFSHHLHHDTSAAPAAANTATTTTGENMSVIDEIETDVKNFADSVAAKFQQVDKTALGWVQAIQSNNEISPALESLGKLAGINVPPGIITAILAPINGLLTAYSAPASQQTAPAQQ